MDLHRLRAGEWIVAVSGAVLLVSLWLPWRSLGEANVDAWQVFSVADILLAVLAVLAIVVCALVARMPAPGPGLAAEALLTLLAIAMAIVALVQVLGTPGSLELPKPLPQPTTGYGAWVGLAATLGILVGLLLAMRDERLSKPGRLTDPTGVPVDEPVHVETLPAPPPA